MPIHLLSKSARRVAAVSVAAIVVIAGAGALSIWRYQVALSRADNALAERTDAGNTAQLIADFYTERDELNAYFFSPSPAAYSQLTAAQRQFRQLATQIGHSSTVGQSQISGAGCGSRGPLLRLLQAAPRRGGHQHNPRERRGRPPRDNCGRCGATTERAVPRAHTAGKCGESRCRLRGGSGADDRHHHPCPCDCRWRGIRDLCGPAARACLQAGAGAHRGAGAAQRP